MYRIGQEELDRIAGVFATKNLFRYLEDGGGECQRFETRYAQRLGVRHCFMTASGTNSLTAALMGAGIGPGDEVIVPACTYMATPISVLAAGAIPVIVDIDESIGMSPAALSDAIGPRTRAVIPVHMWGLPCDMNSIMEIAANRDLLVIEDACQGVGGAYEGRMLGSIGHIGAFSFNHYKNMSCGEGGAVVTDDDAFAERIECAIDPCRFYWDGRKDSFAGYVANGARASEIEGAIMNCQLDRIDDMIATMRAQKSRIIRETAASGLTPESGQQPRLGVRQSGRLPTADSSGSRYAGGEDRGLGRAEDRASRIHRVGSGAGAPRRPPCGGESVRAEAEPGLPDELFEGDVPAVAGHSRQDRVHRDPSGLLG